MTDLLDKSMTKLFKICEDIQQAKDSTNLNIKGIGKKINPITKYFNNYTKVYRKTDASEHVPDIQAMFKRNRVAILRGDDDTWLKERSVTLQYGDGLKETADIKIMLSSFYNSALQVKKNVEEQLEGLPQEAYEDKVELLYPDVLRLHLYRILSEAVEDEKDKGSLKAIVRILETELGIENDSTPDTTPAFSLGNLIGEAQKMAAKAGIKGADQKMPSEGDLMNVVSKMLNAPGLNETIGKLLNSPGLKETLGGIMSDIQTQPDQIFTKLPELSQKLAPHLQEITSSLGNLVPTEGMVGPVGPPTPASPPTTDHGPEGPATTSNLEVVSLEKQ